MPKQRDAETLYFASSRTRGWIDFLKSVTETLGIGEGAPVGSLRAERPCCRNRDRIFESNRTADKKAETKWVNSKSLTGCARRQEQ